MLRWSLQLHKWIALVVGVQILAWVLGGLIMTALPIGEVRGEHRIAHKPLPAIDAKRAVPLARIAEIAQAESLGTATLKATPRGPIWVVSETNGLEGWYDAYTGENVSEITEAQARQAAVDTYAGPGKPVSVRFMDEAPQESGETGSVWRVEFDDPERTAVYLDVFTGEVISRRSNLWRFYDLFWRFHIMNFVDGQNYNHPLIVGVTALTLLVVLTGFVLLWFRLARDWRAARAKRG